MSSRCGSMDRYFQLAVTLFHDFRWVYDFKATDILSTAVLQNIPQSFQTFFLSLRDNDEQFHEILNCRGEANILWPVELRSFVASCQEIQGLSEGLKDGYSNALPSHSTCNKNLNLDNLKLPKKWNLKKYLEVAYVGNFVGHLCSQEQCDAVVDIGSGLGYLTSHLASHFELAVVGVESDPSRVTAAETAYRSTLNSCSTGSQTYCCLQITENMSQEIEPCLRNYNKVCICALHACGDLTPWSLKHFIGTDSCKLLAVAPCCYHKMSMNSSSFPMSNSLISELGMYDDRSFLINQWLWRLASQRAGKNFLNDIRKETENLFYRAILEKFCRAESFGLFRKKRNFTKSNHGSTFDDYLQTMLGPSGGFDVMKDNIKIEGDSLSEVFYQISRLHDEVNNLQS
ncbi:unnamed protein product [Orchesella dallaii]|uniref:Methyltransferase domain-containing protein n=1 Tax=Orchesella dallaii TaxID=48710 RepID=A0ABP1QDD4_9HEXA